MSVLFQSFATKALGCSFFRLAHRVCLKHATLLLGFRSILTPGRSSPFDQRITRDGSSRSAVLTTCKEPIEILNLLANKRMCFQE
jgi:hypothetical protein